MVQRLTVLAMATLLAASGCKKDKGDAPASDPAAKPADKPAEPAADKPAEPAADKPAEPAAIKPAEPPADKPAAEPAWEKFTSKEGGYTIELPGKVEENDIGNGMKMAGATFGTTASDDRTAMCGVAYMELPAGATDAKTMLDASTAKHKQGAQVLEEKDVTLDKHPGRHLVIQNASHRKWMRTYIVSGKIYVINCGGPFDRAATDEPIAKKVLESFALAK